ncbi:hypothetical protein OQJ68_16845, partial [Microbulbifer thermotolerans]
TRGARGKGASFDDLETVDAPAPQGPPAAPAQTKASSTDKSAPPADSDSAKQPQAKADPTEPDNTNSETGQNQSGETSQNNANAVEGGEPI